MKKNLLKKLYGRVVSVFYRYFSYTIANNPASLLSQKELFLFAVAYNSYDVIEKQWYFLKKYLDEDFTYVVCDNSSESMVSGKILSFCRVNHLAYFKLPRNPFSGIDPSRSHGLALNWIYRNLVKVYKPALLGFLDHDVFPYKKTTLTSLFKKHQLFGLVKKRENGWYLWPGFCFFKLDYMLDKTVNFMPCRGLDTGGGNYKHIYRFLNKDKLPYFAYSFLDVSDIKYYNPQNDQVELIGDWLHLINVSKWRDVQYDKLESLDHILQTIATHHI